MLKTLIEHVIYAFVVYVQIHDPVQAFREMFIRDATVQEFAGSKAWKGGREGSRLVYTETTTGNDAGRAVP